MAFGVADGSGGESMSVTLKLENIDVKSIEILGNHKCNVTFNVLEGYKDYYKQYDELRTIIKDSLKALEPWYIGGKVGNPMDAVNALKSIDKAVNS